MAAVAAGALNPKGRGTEGDRRPGSAVIFCRRLGRAGAADGAAGKTRCRGPPNRDADYPDISTLAVFAIRRGPKQSSPGGAARLNPRTSKTSDCKGWPNSPGWLV